MVITKAYKFIIITDFKQQELINGIIGCLIFINNKILEIKLNIKRFTKLEKENINEDNVKEYKNKQIEYKELKIKVMEVSNKEKYKDYSNAIKKGYWNGSMKYCDDITIEWLGSKTKKINKIINHKIGETFRYKGKTYIIDNNHIKLNFKNGEEEFAEILSSLTNKRIELFPRFDCFKSTDAKIGKEYIDFKITTSGTDKFIYGNITNSEYQSFNYIFYIKNVEILDDVINYQIDNVFRRLKHVNKIGIYHNDKFKIYKRK